MADSEMNRRDFMGTAVLLAGGAMSLGASAASASNRRFPDKFLWGASTAAHQIEGNNVASDYCVWENVKPTFTDGTKPWVVRSLAAEAFEASSC
jgi:beta-glucosidase